MAILLEAKVGNESHSSHWGKGNLQGVNLVSEDRTKTNHHNYTSGATEAQDGTVFTWWTSRGDKHGTIDADFYILQADSSAEEMELVGGCYGRGNYLRGQFSILAHGSDKTKAPRLLGWWVDWAPKNGGHTAEVARHLQQQLAIRGRMTPTAM